MFILNALFIHITHRIKSVIPSYCHHWLFSVVCLCSLCLTSWLECSVMHDTCFCLLLKYHFLKQGLKIGLFCLAYILTRKLPWIYIAEYIIWSLPVGIFPNLLRFFSEWWYVVKILLCARANLRPTRFKTLGAALISHTTEAHKNVSAIIKGFNQELSDDRSLIEWIVVILGLSLH